jgi:O-antigen chain-terminating methyltransferase
MSVSVDELMKKVRAAAQFGGPRKLDGMRSEPAGETSGRSFVVRPPLTAPSQPPAGLRLTIDNLSVDSLLELEVEDFVFNAYRWILLREPDVSGLEHYSSALRTGELSRLGMLYLLVRSQEARGRKKWPKGLLRRVEMDHLKWKIRRVAPGLVVVLRWLVGIGKLGSVGERIGKSEQIASGMLSKYRREHTEYLVQHNRELEEIFSRNDLEVAGLRKIVEDLQKKIDMLVSGSGVVESRLGRLETKTVELEGEVWTVTKNGDAEIGKLGAILESVAESGATERSVLQGLESRVASLEVNHENTSLLLNEVSAQAESFDLRLVQHEDRMDDLAFEREGVFESLKRVSIKFDTLSTGFEQTRDELELLSDLSVAVGKLTADLERVSAKVADFQVAADAFDKSREQMESSRSRFEATATSAISALLDQEKEALSRQLDSVWGNLGSLKVEVDEGFSVCSNRLAKLEESVDSRYMEHLGLNHVVVVEHRNEIVRLTDRLNDYRRSLLDQERRLGKILRDLGGRQKLDQVAVKSNTFEQAAKHLRDSMYVAFEDLFRGTRHEIQQRARVYLPRIREFGLGTPDKPIVDLGCGRGEWLELVKGEGFTALGVDSNSSMIAECFDQGLDVVEQDALEFLQSRDSHSVGVLSGFHIIEHLPNDVLVAVLDEALRVLVPGGFVMFETPNPENLVVGACNFHYDPTHLKPLPPQMMRFIVENRGFVDSEIVYLSEGRGVDGVIAPVASSIEGSETINAIVNVVRSNFFIAPDYAVIAFKA